MNIWNNIKDNLKLMCFYAGRCVLHVFFVFPIKKNRITFISMAGKQYSCNPKYISEYLQKKYAGKYEIIWSIRDPKLIKQLERRGIKAVKYRSIQHYYYKITSKVSISNSHWGNEIPSRKSQVEIYTGHGGGGGTKQGAKNDKTIHDNIAHYIGYMLDSKRYTIMMASSKLMLKNTCREGMCFKGPVIAGTPRNDILINRNRPDLTLKVRKYFNLRPGVNLLLYAPTWRNNGNEKDFYTIDYERLKENLKKRFGGEWVILMRLHNLVDRTIMNNVSGVVDATDYPDMHELLYVVDAVISDYSSFVWDFSFTYRPCFLYCPDLDQYICERDFNTPIETWGFPVCKNNNELEDMILGFDSVAYTEGLKKRQKICGSYEDGKATRRIVRVINAMCYGKGVIPPDVKLV